MPAGHLLQFQSLYIFLVSVSQNLPDSFSKGNRYPVPLKYQSASHHQVYSTLCLIKHLVVCGLLFPFRVLFYILEAVELAPEGFYRSIFRVNWLAVLGGILFVFGVFSSEVHLELLLVVHSATDPAHVSLSQALLPLITHNCHSWVLFGTPYPFQQLHKLSLVTFLVFGAYSFFS